MIELHLSHTALGVQKQDTKLTSSSHSSSEKTLRHDMLTVGILFSLTFISAKILIK